MHSSSFAGLNSLFTCGGYGDDALADAEVIDLPSLEGSNPDQNCNQVPDMPDEKDELFAMWDDDDQSILCCGGEPVSLEGKRCFKYIGEEWIDLGDVLRHQRRSSSASKLSDGRYWIMGGFGYEWLCCTK